MIRTIFLALLGIGLVVALAYLFPLMQPGWYGTLLFQACLFFGGFGLVAGYACGLLTRRGDAQGNAAGRLPRGLGGRIEPGQISAPSNSAFITSPTDARPGKWPTTSRRPSNRAAN